MAIVFSFTTHVQIEFLSCHVMGDCEVWFLSVLVKFLLILRIYSCNIAFRVDFFLENDKCGNLMDFLGFVHFLNQIVH
jgi:hypothetical protein